ncbi:methyl-accepting chemotaxis protein [Desulfosporosinus acidiphilus SJ4]|uniref:Methyl-accepting chemotaxis protein n=1 Tax=Desulfosporosinus acidiphilus (strain DSM 22704 / JCM 16185 / SJ4) TaxID=646529 RepID=I4D270_DESAJ|nr:methyl-accepting chemotaxis protein [Desulfosporosinus acidiphilus]AFM39894.1 methyl-accepting chemotaxis protein [Desulfosporosinus acidiphilus SJ4]
MKWFYNLKISTKLLISFIIVALLSGIVGYVGIQDLLKTNGEYADLYIDHGISLSYLANVSDGFQRMRVNLRDLMVDTNQNNKQKYVEGIKIYEKQAEDNMALYQANLKSSEDRAAFSQLQDAWNKLLPVVDKETALATNHQEQQAYIVSSTDGATVTQLVDSAIKKEINLNITTGKQLSDQYRKDSQSTVAIMIGIIAFCMLLAVALGLLLSRIISKPIRRLAEGAEKIALGEVDLKFAAATKDELGILENAFGKMVENIRSQAEAADRIATGDLNVQVTIRSEKDVLSKSLQQVVTTLRSLLDEMEHMSKEHDLGDIDVFVSAENFKGAYRTVANGVNDMVKGHISVNMKAITCVAEFGKGNFDVELEKFPGKKAIINQNIESLRHNLKEVSSEVRKLIVSSKEGRLNERADAKKFQGDWAELIQGLNGLIDAILEPIQEAAAVLDEMAKGNLGTNVKGNYKGDHAKIKNALNDTISTLASYVSEISQVLTQMANGNLDVEISRDYRGDFSEIKKSLNNIIQALNDVLSDINNASTQVAAGSRQVSDSAQSLSQGSTEQASAIEELTASLEEIASQTKLNASNANKANELAFAAKEDAAEGNNQMKEMLRAMDAINEASSNISKIIKVIDEIAFQTNTLALNAAVEAARAGQHGKGFAVVAEEVRNLATRSANAAKETTLLIEGSIKKVEDGTKIANNTASALIKIVNGVAEAASLVGEIATASNEQALGVTQVNQGIQQVSAVVQTNSATSEESAAASEELSSQAELLREQVSRFKLKRTRSTSYNNLDDLNPEVIKMLESMRQRKRENSMGQVPREPEATIQKPKITLSDSEFGKY